MTTAAHIGGWITPVGDALLSSGCVLRSFKIEELTKKKKNTEKERKHLFNHTELAVEPSTHSTCLIAFLLYPRLSPPLYPRTLRPFLLRVSIFFKQMAGVFRRRGVDSRRAHWSMNRAPQPHPPKATSAIDFTMILIRGLPVAIDAIHQRAAQ